MIYFDPNIWGTVSDWFMAIVTTVTAYYLYKTLQSQKEVQITQNKLFEIESIRFRESIKPSLKYSISKEIITLDQKKDSKIFTVEIVNETNNTALEISVEHREEKNIKRVSFAPIKQRHLKINDEPYLIHFLIEDFTKNLNYILFTLNYKDISGAKYKQRVIGIADNFGTEINPSLPEIEN